MEDVAHGTTRADRARRDPPDRPATCDPAGDHDWGISAEVDLAASDEAGAAVVRITDVGSL